MQYWEKPLIGKLCHSVIQAFCSVTREPYVESEEREDSPSLLLRQMYGLIEDFVSACCFHLWTTVLWKDIMLLVLEILQLTMIGVIELINVLAVVWHCWHTDSNCYCLLSVSQWLWVVHLYWQQLVYVALCNYLLRVQTLSDLLRSSCACDMTGKLLFIFE